MEIKRRREGTKKKLEIINEQRNRNFNLNQKSYFLLMIYSMMINYKL